MKFLRKIIKRINGFQYINVGEIVDNRYFGWPKPRKKDKYVGLNPTTGEIDWEYKFDDDVESWFKANPDGVVCDMDTSLRRTPLTFALSCGLEGIDKEDEKKWENYPEITPTSENNVYEDSTDTFKQYTIEADTATISIELPNTYSVTKWTKNGEDIEETSGVTSMEVIAEEAAYTIVIEKKG